MTWNDYYRRREAIEAALKHARKHPTDRPGPETVPAARGIFADSDELLCALQHKWTQILTGRLDLAATADRNGHDDRVSAVQAAWLETAAANPALRAVLDKHADPPAEPTSPKLREALARERRMLAQAGGLAEAGDDGHDTARVGSTIRTLIELGERAPSRATRRRPLVTSS